MSTTTSPKATSTPMPNPLVTTHAVVQDGNFTPVTQRFYPTTQPPRPDTQRAAGARPTGFKEAGGDGGDASHPARSGLDVTGQFQRAADEDIPAYATRLKAGYVDYASDYAACTSGQLQAQLRDTPDIAASTELNELVAAAGAAFTSSAERTAKYFAAGAPCEDPDPAMRTRAVGQHTGYVLGELVSKTGDAGKALAKQWSENDREGEKHAFGVLHEFLGKQAPGQGPTRAQLDELTTDMGIPLNGPVHAFITAGGNGYLFEGLGTLSLALNYPGAVAGDALVDCVAKALELDKGEAAKRILLALERPDAQLRTAFESPRSTDDFIVLLAARLAQQGWLVSTAGRALCDGHPKRVTRDIFVDFDTLKSRCLTEVNHPDFDLDQLVRDVTQVRTAVRTWMAAAAASASATGQSEATRIAPNVPATGR